MVRLADRLEAMLAMGPARTFEDVPISLCLYPFLVPEDGALVVRGSGQRREGRRWGMSATWDGETPHHMLPAEAVLARPPRAGMLVTGCQPFDFVYDVAELEERLRGDSHCRRSAKAGLAVAQGVPRVDMLSIHALQPHVTEASFGLFIEMVDCQAAGVSSCSVHGLSAASGETLGFAVLWHEEGTCFHVHRSLHPRHRRHARFFDAELCRFARERGFAEMNMGDALRLPGVLSYKLELRPKRLGLYVNVLDEEEGLDHERAF